MSFMNNRMRSRQQIPMDSDEFSNEVIKTIISNCSSIEMDRSSDISERLQELPVEISEEEKATIQKAKIFVCNRRRAILEGASCHSPTRTRRSPKNSTSESTYSTSSNESNAAVQTMNPIVMNAGEKIARKRNPSDQPLSNESSSSGSSDTANDMTASFLGEQYTDQNLDWSYDFDFHSWNNDFDISEVYIKNFCSFLESDRGDNCFKGRTAMIESQKLYDNLPTSRLSLNDLQINNLGNKAIEELKQLSNGQVERLASRLSEVKDVHYIFKDTICYGARPPVMIFWFLSMVRRNARSLTFDRIQSAVSVELHDVLSLANIHSLTINQPHHRVCIKVDHVLLTKWMKLPMALRKRISIHLNGCKDITPQGIEEFVNEWRNTEYVAMFKQISIDGNSYKYNEFVNALEPLQDVMLTPPLSPYSQSFSSEENAHALVFEKVVEVRHLKDPRFLIVLKYCKPSRKMVLTIERDENAIMNTKSPVQTLSRLSLARPHSAAAINDIRRVSTMNSLSSDTYKHFSRPMSQNSMRISGCRENNPNGSMINRFIRFLSASS